MSVLETYLTRSERISKRLFGHRGTATDQELASRLEFSSIDRSFKSAIGKFTYSLSPAAITLAYSDWFLNLALSPGQQLYFAKKAYGQYQDFFHYVLNCSLKEKPKPCVDLQPTDKRFKDEAWQNPPFSFIYHSFLMTQQWWEEVSTTVLGVSKHHTNMVSFGTRQFLDIFSPSNNPFLNPEIIKATKEEMGQNFVRGGQYFLEDSLKSLFKEQPESMKKFKVGEDIAITPGKVIYQNNLIELIQYTPQTEEVFAEPVLFVPAWIMKYYILDLSPHNSLVKYLIEKGHTVFMISWKNPTSVDRNLRFEDYLTLGILEALEVISKIFPHQKVQGAGYCLGGTLLAMAAAYLAKYDGDQLKSVTLLAAQTDFEEAGEILMLVDESQVNFLKSMMWDKGYLDKRHIRGTFQMLRSNDLVWSYMLKNYLLGKRAEPTNFNSWNDDETRLPYQMHSEYLTEIYLQNDLAEGRFMVDGHVIALHDLKFPLFCVGTETDHISPWKSVYKIHLLTDTTITFVLASGGHNVGIISEPGHPKGKYQMSTSLEDDHYLTPEEWQGRAPSFVGTWWVDWQKWLVGHSSPQRISAPLEAGNKEFKPLREAPGTYVCQQ